MRKTEADRRGDDTLLVKVMELGAMLGRIRVAAGQFFFFYHRCFLL